MQTLDPIQLTGQPVTVQLPSQLANGGLLLLENLSLYELRCTAGANQKWIGPLDTDAIPLPGGSLSLSIAPYIGVLVPPPPAGPLSQPEFGGAGQGIQPSSTGQFADVLLITAYMPGEEPQGSYPATRSRQPVYQFLGTASSNTAAEVQIPAPLPPSCRALVYSEGVGTGPGAQVWLYSTPSGTPITPIIGYPTAQFGVVTTSSIPPTDTGIMINAIGGGAVNPLSQISVWALVEAVGVYGDPLLPLPVSPAPPASVLPISFGSPALGANAPVIAAPGTNLRVQLHFMQWIWTAVNTNVFGDWEQTDGVVLVNDNAGITSPRQIDWKGFKLPYGVGLRYHEAGGGAAGSTFANGMISYSLVA